MEGGPNIQERDTSISDDNHIISEGDVEDNGNNGSGCLFSFCHPKGKFHRLIALFFMCFLGFGSYFCYDSPGALQTNFMRDLNITNTEYSLFYSLYSWPNTVLCFVGGFLVDRVFGIRLGAIIYMTITLIGQLFFAFGTYYNLFWMMSMGRFIFGIGGESLAVTQNNYAVLWFKGKELNMVFGLQLSFARVGSSVCFWVIVPIYNWISKNYDGYECLGITLFIATLTCVLSMFCALILGFLDRRAERITNRVVASSDEKIQLKDIKDFKATFWLLSVICVMYYVAIFPFIAFAKKYFMDRFDLDEYEANKVASLVYLISVFGSPILGLMVDLLGRNILFVLIATIVTIFAHFLLAFTYVTPYVGMVLMGLAYSLLASGLWPLVSLIIPEAQLGTAYGLCQSIQNLGLAIFTLLVGAINDTYGSDIVEIFFIGSLICALLATVIIWIVNHKIGGTLNMSMKRRKELQEQEQQSQDDGSERLLNDAASMSHDSLQPNSEDQIRNRYLSKIGAPLPNNYVRPGI